MQDVQINRDPFARSSTVRRLVPTDRGCSNCGSKRKSGKLFEYGSQRDSVSSIYTSYHKGLFCDKECHDSYHG